MKHKKKTRGLAVFMIAVILGSVYTVPARTTIDYTRNPAPVLSEKNRKTASLSETVMTLRAGKKKQLKCQGVSGTVKQWSELLRISPYTIYEWVNVHGMEYAETRIIETVHNGGMVEQTVVKKCEKCGEEYTVLATASKAKYCASCKKIAEREKHARYNAKRKTNCGARVVWE